MLSVGLDLTCAAAPRPTGVGLAAAHLGRALRVDAGALDLDVRLLCRWTRRHTQAAALAGAPVTRFDARWSVLLARRLDVFHGPDARLPRLRGPALVATVHDLSSRRPGFAPDGFRRTREGHWQDVARRADLVVTYTRAVRDEVAAGLGLPHERIAVVPLAPTGGLAPPPPAERQAVARRLTGGRPFVLALGERSRRKNAAGAARALAAAGPSLADHALVLVGPAGHGHEEVAAALARPDLRGRVVVTDYLPRAEVAALLAEAAALVFPSRYEGFGLPVLEAFAAGLPVVASTDPSVVEVAGGAALHADADDPDGLGAGLARLVQDAALRADLVDRGRARAAAFTWPGAARALSDVYRAAAASAPATEVAPCSP
ncbi:MAG: glycosyltransferase family 4 protein [Planctomycetes bacterium]|nr:glycosyltransferase family 4 protein [Planctomycetota bacterium]